LWLLTIIPPTITSFFSNPTQNNKITTKETTKETTKDNKQMTTTRGSYKFLLFISMLIRQGLRVQPEVHFRL